jgi:hypothetical protein
VSRRSRKTTLEAQQLAPKFAWPVAARARPPGGGGCVAAEGLAAAQRRRKRSHVCGVCANVQLLRDASAARCDGAARTC